MSKQISIIQAAELVQNGQMLALGGMTLYRRPMAFVLQLLRRFYHTGSPRQLTLLNFTASLESDLMVGAGMIERVRSCYFGLEIFGLAPMFSSKAQRGELIVQEETEASIALGLRAAMAGIGFMPGRAWIGTDLPKLRPDVKPITDPYSGEELLAFPAIRPDVAVIHALKADPDGNALIGGNRAIDPELALSSKTVIITAEEIVPALDKADIVAPLVTCVVHAPNGAWPTSCHPYYGLDGLAILEYSDRATDEATFAQYLESLLTTHAPA